LRQATILAAAVILGGCTATTSSPQGSSASTEITGSSLAGNNTSNEATMAAFAARAQHPNGNAQQSQYTAVVTTAGAIEVINPTDQPLNDGTLWVNGKYVAQVPPIAPRGAVTLSRNHFFDRDGHTMDWSAEKLNKLELQSGDQLYAVNGPAYM